MLRSVLAVAVAALLLGLAAPASAHTEESSGPVDLEIGFRDEPAYVGAPNAVFIEVSHDGHPVTDLGRDLTVTVTYGNVTSDPMTFQPLEEPGQYQAPFIPSQPGPYTFTLAGRVEDTEIDLSVTSGPRTFDEVQEPTEAMFPPMEAMPSTMELAERIDREAARAREATDAALAAAREARDAVSGARGLAVAGLAVGALGVILAALALVRRKG